MAVVRRTRRAKVEKPVIVASNAEEITEEVRGGEETVTVASHLPFALKFDDVPSGNGTKTVIIPSVNDHLRGNPNGGILLGKGKAIAFTLPKKDWEAIKRMHGKEAAFTGVGGNLPCLIEMRDKEEFKARQDEIREMVSGLEPQDPNALQVEEAKKAE